MRCEPVNERKFLYRSRIFELWKARTLAVLLSAAALGAGAAACGGSASGGDSSTSAAADGQIVGAGSFSQEISQEVWAREFGAASPGRQISYETVGSEEGRRRFIDGETAFAASDSPLEGEELTEAAARCRPGELIELPVYISPIILFANLRLTAMELSPQTLAKIFNGEITRWDDPTIKRENPTIGPIGLPPKLEITPVGLTEEPTMTEAVTAYIADGAPGLWDHGTSGVWPIEGSKTARDATDVAEVVGSKKGSFGYTDFAHVGELFGVTRLMDGNQFFLEPNPRAATQRLEAAHLDAALAKGPKMLPVEQEPRTPARAYPIVLTSYLIACTAYDSDRETAAVEAYVKYVAGRRGQAVSAQEAGTAYPPLWLGKKILAAIR